MMIQVVIPGQFLIQFQVLGEETLSLQQIPTSGVLAKVTMRETVVLKTLVYTGFNFSKDNSQFNVKKNEGKGKESELSWELRVQS